ncbi:hypothetical protein FGLOB1_1037 [Fusarium globosum]|uniref:Uncharacterized protein n=1 Tax=Fusarium globosum TaxID=78864 RepID=A0A8H5YX39_9HYPO|nr:hypothetical protein FGLOB1_1037 [Fusarium globosum]
MSLTESKTKSQKLGLFDLPDELLLCIFEAENLEWRDHLNIHHVSSRLFQLTFKHVYNGKREIFEHACYMGNLDLIIECLKHRNVPTSRLWETTGRREICWTPLDILSLGFWMDADEHHGICQVIEFLIDKGLGFPSERLRRVLPAKKGGHPGYREFAKGFDSIMQIMLQSAVPPALFEVFLNKMLSDRGMTLRSRLAPGHRVDIDWHEWTGLHDLVHILFDDLFAPWIYKGDSPSYFSDTFEAKIKLLIKYDGIDGNEQSALENILEALRRIEAKQRDNGGLNFERDGTWCWREICLSIYQTPFLGRRVGNRYSQEYYPQAINPINERRVHEFAIPGMLWYPPEILVDARSTIFEHVHDKLDPSWLEDNTDRDWVNMPLDAWNFIGVKKPGLAFMTKGGRRHFLSTGRIFR